MANSTPCVRCGSELSGVLPVGLCPACLLQAALSDEPASAFPRIEGYDLIEEIGAGGMGVVYKARQHHPIQRIVAIKLIKLGMDTRELIARFESERQALAMLNHPNVAAVYHADATESGRPFFAMEYVPGEPITAFCDRHHYTTRQRLELFVQACQGIEHAHQKAILHRDIKPSNLLVTLDAGTPLVKVIDFGVAKAMQQRLTEQTMFTAHGQLIGTPEYMSPEQAELNAVDVDTRSDVYSLGVVLYELLSGTLPFDPQTLRSAAFAEVQRIIREVDPPRPSARLSSVANAAAIAMRHQTQAEALAKELKRELEWIPLKALRKDRATRYVGVSELADDVRNYLAGRPLIAGPESAGYRLRKFVRRNKGRVAVASAITALILAGAAVSTWQALRLKTEQQRTLAQKQEADRRRTEAETAEATAAEINRFLAEMLSSVQPNLAQGKEVLVLDVLMAASAKIENQFQRQPLVRRELHLTIGDSLMALYKPDLALPHFERAVQLSSQSYGPDDPRTLITRQRLGYPLLHLRRYNEAERLVRDLLARSLQDNNVPKREILSAKLLLAHILSHDPYQREQSEQLYREAIEEQIGLYGPDAPATLRTRCALALLLSTRRKDTEADQEFRTLLEHQTRVLGADHTETIWTKHAYGDFLANRGRDAEAEPLLRKAVERNRQLLGESDPRTRWAVDRLARSLRRLNRGAEADQLLRAHRELIVPKLGVEARGSLRSADALAAALRGLGRFDEAEEIDRASLRSRIQSLGEDSFDATETTIALARDLVGGGRFVEAEEHLLSLRGVLLLNGQNTHPIMEEVMRSLVKVYDGTNRPQQAAKVRAELSAIAPTTRQTPGTRPAFPSTLPAAGEWTPDFIERANSQAYWLRTSQQVAAAVALRQQVVSEAKRLYTPGHPLLLKYQNGHSSLLVELKRMDEAETQLLEGYRGLQASGADQVALQTQAQRLVNLYGLWDKPEKAAEWRARHPSTRRVATTRSATTPSP